MKELTSFQKCILHVLSRGSMYGLAIKEELEEYYSEEINHGRLYPNLEHLINQGYVTKNEIDKRTNEYQLTEKGRKELLKEIEWEIQNYVSDDESRIETIEKTVSEIVS